jgi:hypothetical protein
MSFLDLWAVFWGAFGPDKGPEGTAAVADRDAR